jgi:hypothetical protein
MKYVPKKPDFASVPADLPEFDEKSRREYIEKWARDITPLIERDGKVMRIVMPEEKFNQSFPWSPKIIGEATLDTVDVLAEIWTLHNWGYYGFFKPSIAEVISQIPEEIIGEVKSFLVIGPDDITDLRANDYCFGPRAVHTARTILFKRNGEPGGVAGLVQRAKSIWPEWPTPKKKD